MNNWKTRREPDDGQRCEFMYRFPKGWRRFTGVYRTAVPRGRGFYDDRGVKMARFRPAESKIKWRAAPSTGIGQNGGEG